MPKVLVLITKPKQNLIKSKHTTSMNIRNVNHHDLNELHELNQSNLPQVNSLSKKQMSEFLNKYFYFRLIEIDRKTTAFLLAFDDNADYDSINFTWFRNHYQQFAYIDRIIVAPQYRQQGYAYQLYRDLETYSKEKNILLLACEYNIKPENHLSKIFHQRYGFHQVGQQNTENGKKTVSLQIKYIS